MTTFPDSYPQRYSTYAGFNDDHSALREAIKRLQNTSGAVAPQYQALFNDIVTRSDGIAGELEAFQNLIPVITVGPVSAQVGVRFEYHVQASNGPTIYAADGLPPKLTMNGDGTITGVPSGPSDGDVTLSVSNRHGTGYASFRLTVS
jgi:hypothetical protein